MTTDEMNALIAQAKRNGYPPSDETLKDRQWYQDLMAQVRYERSGL